VAGYAQQVAQAGVETSTLLGGLGNGTEDAPRLDPALAQKNARTFFQALDLGPAYSLTILAATPTLLTVQVSTMQAIFLWPGPVPLSEQASETPQADTTMAVGAPASKASARYEVSRRVTWCAAQGKRKTGTRWEVY
jgi:hypothetical protein